MRKEIETLVRWYVPVYIGMLIASFLILTHWTESINLLWLMRYMEFGDNLVVAIWLYFQARRDSGRKWIWAFFGFVAQLFAAVIYLGLKLYEDRNETFNKRLNPDAE
jgi:hypothetical protein